MRLPPAVPGAFLVRQTWTGLPARTIFGLPRCWRLALPLGFPLLPLALPGSDLNRPRLPQQFRPTLRPRPGQTLALGATFDLARLHPIRAVADLVGAHRHQPCPHDRPPPRAHLEPQQPAE